MKTVAAGSVFLAALRSAVIVALVLGAAGALTHYVALPEPLGTLTWIVAGGYSAFVIAVTALIVIAFAAAASGHGKLTVTDRRFRR